jgi:hypothetical protein
MSLLQHEINAFVDTHPGSGADADTDFIEVNFKDRSSFAAAAICMEAFGTMMANRAATETLLASGKTAAQHPESYNYAKVRALEQLDGVNQQLDAARWRLYAQGEQTATVKMRNADADLLLDTMAITPDVTFRQGDLLSYYADLMPTLLAEAQLSVDGDSFKYSV